MDIVFLFFLLALSFLLGRRRDKIPIFFTKETFSIGIMNGDSPFNLKETREKINPIIHPSCITDFPCRFVADPFLYYFNKKWYIFYEAMDITANLGRICYSYSDDMIKWLYGGIAILENHHLSYPYIITYGDDIFIIPETSRNYELKLYKCLNFPNEWEFDSLLLRGRYTEPTIILHENIWYLFVTEYDSSVLRLFTSDKINCGWIEHPKSPIVVNNKAIARSSGKIITYKSHIYRFSQDCTNIYGENVRAHKIIKLTEKEYIEKEYSANPILQPSGQGWNSHRMHHIHLIEKSPENWVAVVDGLSKRRGIYFRY